MFRSRPRVMCSLDPASRAFMYLCVVRPTRQQREVRVFVCSCMCFDERCIEHILPEVWCSRCLCSLPSTPANILCLYPGLSCAGCRLGTRCAYRFSCLCGVTTQVALSTFRTDSPASCPVRVSFIVDSRNPYEPNSEAYEVRMRKNYQRGGDSLRLQYTGPESLSAFVSEESTDSMYIYTCSKGPLMPPVSAPTPPYNVNVQQH